MYLLNFNVCYDKTVYYQFQALYLFIVHFWFFQSFIPCLVSHPSDNVCRQLAELCASEVLLTKQIPGTVSLSSGITLLVTREMGGVFSHLFLIGHAFPLSETTFTVQSPRSHFPQHPASDALLSS